MEESVRTAGTWLNLSVLALVFGLSVRFALRFLFVGVVWMLITFVYGFFFRKRAKGTMSDASRSPTSAIPQPAPRERSLLEVSPLFITVMLVSTLFFTFIGGNLRTALREWYLVSSSNDRMVYSPSTGATAVYWASWVL